MDPTLPQSLRHDFLMEIEHGLIQYHRIYWGWFGVNQLTQNAVRKAVQPT